MQQLSSAQSVTPPSDPAACLSRWPLSLPALSRGSRAAGELFHRQSAEPTTAYQRQNIRTGAGCMSVSVRGVKSCV